MLSIHVKKDHGNVDENRDGSYRKESIDIPREETEKTL